MADKWLLQLDDFDDELSKPDISKIIDFKGIKPIKFGDDRLKSLEYESCQQIYNFDNPLEVYLDSEYSLGYLYYKYKEIYFRDPKDIRFFEDDIPKSFINKLLENLKIPNDAYNFTHSFRQNGLELDNLIIHFKGLFFYYNDTVIHLVYSQDQLDDKTSILYILMGLIKKYKKPSNEKNKIYVIYHGANGFKKKSFEIKKKLNIDLEHNYNDGFSEVMSDIIKKLNDTNKSGLVILHGSPGTGKTTSIRYLAGRLKRNIIFVSPDMVQHITSPDFIPFLMDNSNCILVIEDAEPVLQKRHADDRSVAVSNILNMTDGLLSDCLNISILATFNTNMTNIDDALLRKGRLLKSYKFEKLSKEKSQHLLNKIGKNTVATSEMALSEIYFDEEKNDEAIEFKRPKTGFKK